MNQNLEQQIIERFDRGIELFKSGAIMPCDRPDGETHDLLPEKYGWIAAKEMEDIRLKFLQECKEYFQ